MRQVPRNVFGIVRLRSENTNLFVEFSIICLLTTTIFPSKLKLASPLTHTITKLSDTRGGIRLVIISLFLKRTAIYLGEAKGMEINMKEKAIVWTKENGIFTITMNSPSTMNA